MHRLCEEGVIGQNDTVVVVNTASGLKDASATATAVPKIPIVDSDAAQLEETLKNAYGYRVER